MAVDFLLPETWRWNVHRGAFSMSVVEREVIKMHEPFGMGEKAKGVECGVAEWAKQCTVR